MEVEHDVKVIPIDANLQAEVDRLTKDGWELAPGVKPVAVYHVVRMKHATAAGALGELKIDDSRIMVLNPDGTLQ